MKQWSLQERDLKLTPFNIPRSISGLQRKYSHKRSGYVVHFLFRMVKLLFKPFCIWEENRTYLKAIDIESNQSAKLFKLVGVIFKLVVPMSELSFFYIEIFVELSVRSSDYDNIWLHAVQITNKTFMFLFLNVFNDFNHRHYTLSNRLLATYLCRNMLICHKLYMLSHVNFIQARLRISYAFSN